ncbi:hypothetical protein EST38_g14513 [Candolleomyces aberdarensis]|uniref:Enoyl reductase (ER) domain-containing protein n=1 Tax=Candolleomyces aberdarensis TaxID=2316362 RepID=A0A4Q2CY91_9AGAR|nr:hypothetical protein EST38_g14513 [Candolleomyces aberdarensis]
MSTSTTSATQKALFLTKASGDFIVSTAPIYKPGKEEVLVKIHAAALNPADWKVVTQYSHFLSNFPSILGSDIAGEVVELGEGATGFAIGDRVLFQGIYNDNSHAGFQQYTTADVNTLAKIPSGISYDEAASVPLALTTAWVGFYNESPNGLGFDAPTNAAARGKYSDTPIIVIGGASSVGQLTVQTAKLSGFNPIITTASSKHAEFLKSLGATHVLDRNVSLAGLKESIQSITEKPVKIVVDTISSEETQTLGFNLLAPGGQIALNQSAIGLIKEAAPKENKSLVGILALKQGYFELVQEMWTHVTKFLQDRDIQPNRVEVLPKGLDGVVEGLKRLEENRVSGVKLVVRPQETA